MTKVSLETLPCGIRYRHWAPDGEPKAAVVLVHGLGEHSGRYQHVAEAFIARGFAVVAPDHMGHGESPGERVFVSHFDDYLAGVRECRQLISSHYPERPCFILGHSMGGLITARLLLEDQAQYQGALFSGPAFAAGEPPPAPVMWIGRLLAKLLPRMGMLALDGSGVSRDPKVVAAYEADPLVNHGKVTAGLGIAIFDAMDQVMNQAGTLTLPMLIMHGGADTLAAPAGSEAFAERVTAKDVSLQILPGLYHEIFNEPEGEGIVATYADWIEARLP
ncbi:MAG: lysophospholipase [Luminiphilus sp.]|nr:lysophospholipase [Luminiphilus sp.]